jgi:hypothetical protein
MSCTNRIGIIKDGNRYELRKEELYRLSVEKTRRLMR